MSEDDAPARIIVAFQKTAGGSEVLEFEKRHGLKMVTDLPAANSRVYLVSGSKNLAETLKSISGESTVRYAEIDGEVSIR